jgi:fucose permease
MLAVGGTSRQLALASLGFVSLGLPEGMLGVAWPSIRATFGLPLDALGLLLSTFATGYFLSSAVSGWVIGRFGVGTTLAASCGATGLALVGYSLSPVWESMVLLGAILGLGAGTIDGGLNTYAAVAHGSRVLNWMHAAFGIGAAIGPLVMTAILTSGLTWNVGYALVAAAQLTLAGAYWLTRASYASARPRTEPAQASAPPSAEPARASAPTSAEPARASAPTSARALLGSTVAWVSLALFFAYVGMEVTAGQWSFSLFTLSRGTPATVGGLLVSAYWASLTLGRVIFGFVVDRVSPVGLLRACMAISVVAAGLIWLNIPWLSWVALAVLGLVFAPIFPVLIAETPSRLGMGQTANAVGLQVAAAVLGGATIPATIGVLAARLSLEVIGPCLVALGVAQLVLHEATLRSTRRAAPN